MGIREDEEEAQVGPYGLGHRNERGIRLIKFAQENNLKIANTFYKKKASSRWTWCAPNGRTRNEIDFILCDNIAHVSDVHVVKNLKFDSDHRMVISSMQIKKRRRYCRKNSGPRPNQVDKDIFASNLQRSLSQNPNRKEQSVQDTYNLLEQQLVDASKNAIK